MVIYSKIVKPLWDKLKTKTSRNWSLLRSLTCFSFALTGFIFAIWDTESIFNQGLGKLCILCGCITALISGCMDIFDLKNKWHRVKIFYYALMLLLGETTICISLFYLWSSFVTLNHNSMNVWMILLVGAIVYFTILLVLLNCLNHFMLIYYTTEESKKNQLKYSAPLRAFVCIISFFSFFGSIVFIFDLASQNHYLCVQVQIILGIYVILSVRFLSNGEEAKIQSRLSALVHFAKDAIHPVYLLIPIVLIYIKIICNNIYRYLTISKIVLEFEKENAKTIRDPYEQFFSVIFFICIFSIVQDIWLKSTVEQDVRLREDEKIEEFNNTAKIETDV